MKRVLLAGSGLAVAVLFSGCMNSSVEAAPHHVVVTHKYEGMPMQDMSKDIFKENPMAMQKDAPKDVSKESVTAVQKGMPLNVNYPNFYINTVPKKAVRKPVEGPLISWDSYNYGE